MDDYKGIFAQECEELPSREYLVRVVSITSLKEYWRVTVVASSKKRSASTMENYVSAY